MTEPIAPDAPQNRLPLILGIGAGVLILIFLLSQMLGGDDDDADTTSSTVPTAPAPSTVVPTTAPGTGAPAETFETFNTKNPFVPLRILSSGGGGGGATTTATGGGTAIGGGTTATATGGTSGGTATGGTATSGGTSTGRSTTGGTSTEPIRGARVALLDVFAEGGKVVANVKVNDTVYKVSDGQVFATSFKVVALSQADDCGRFVFGDDAFRLCKGEESLK